MVFWNLQQVQDCKVKLVTLVGLWYALNTTNLNTLEMVSQGNMDDFG